VTRLAALDAEGLRPHVAAVASVYGAAMRRSPEVVVQRRDIITRHLVEPGLVAAVAFQPVPDGAAAEAPGGAEVVIGFGYGFTGSPGQWWHDAVARALPDRLRDWLTDCFELAELHVLPAAQGAGVGARLLGDVVARSNARHVLLSTPDTETPARRLYRREGFVDLLTAYHFPGSREPYAVMGLRR
jgi:GNAT superfamily N-acetyltransferase